MALTAWLTAPFSPEDRSATNMTLEIKVLKAILTLENILPGFSTTTEYVSKEGVASTFDELLEKLVEKIH